MLEYILTALLILSQPVPLEPVDQVATKTEPAETAASTPSLYEEAEIEDTDDIVTEEDFAASYVNYMAPPDTIKAEPAFTATGTRTASDTELALALARIDSAIDQCIKFRQIIETKIGDRPGSYSVNTEWMTAYQNCILQRKSDLNRFETVLERRYASIVVGNEQESVTRLTDLVDRLNVRHSQLSRKLRLEIRLQKKFVAYYNTGQKNY